MSTTEHNAFVAGIQAMVAETRNKFAKEIEVELKKLPYDQHETMTLIPVGGGGLRRQGAGSEYEEWNQQVAEAPTGYLWPRLCRQGAGSEYEEWNQQVAEAPFIKGVTYFEALDRIKAGGFRRTAAGPSDIDLEEPPQVTVTPEGAMAPVSEDMTYFEAPRAIKVGELRRQGAGAGGGDDNEYPQLQHDGEEESARIDAALDRESYLD